MAEKVDYATLKKGGFMRQRQKDRFSLRLHTVGGALTADDLRNIGQIADRFGNGTVHLTARQGVEIPFVRLQDVEAIRAALAEVGLRPGVCGPRVRTVTACQGNRVCPSANIDTTDIAQKIDERYYGVELPHKFKFGVTGCHNNCLKAEENDVGIKGSCKVTWLEDPCIGCGICEKACRDGAITMQDGKVVVDYGRCTSCGRCAKACPVDAWRVQRGCFTVSFGGQFGSKLVQGRTVVPVIEDEETLFRVTDAAIDYFKEHARKGERLAQLLKRVGTEEFDQKIREAYRG
ncbi:MAG: 4Fe-4S binding protein [Atopobiaceae bacterium]